MKEVKEGREAKEMKYGKIECSRGRGSKESQGRQGNRVGVIQPQDTGE